MTVAIKLCASVGVVGRNVGWSLRDDLVQSNFNYNQALAVDKVFSYPTTVYGWKVRVKNNREKEGWLLLQVWRRKFGGFYHVGSTNFTFGRGRGPGYTDAELLLQSGDQISVEQGDIIGLFLPNGTNGLPFAFGSASATSTIRDDSADVIFFDDQDPPAELVTTDYVDHTNQIIVNIYSMIGQCILYVITSVLTTYLISVTTCILALIVTSL